MGRKIGSKNKVVRMNDTAHTYEQQEVRLSPPEQVRDSKEATGFKAGGSVYEPLKKLSVSQIRDLILSSSWIDTCVNTIVDEVIKYPLIVEPVKGNEEIINLLNYPSETEPLLTIRKKYLKDMLRYGNGCSVIGYKKGKPSGFKVVPGYTLRVTDDEPCKYTFLKVDGSEFLTDEAGEPIVLENKEVMHFQIDADSDATLARSPLERVYDSIKIDKNINTKLVGFTDKGFFKPAFVSIPKTNRAEVEEFVEFLNNTIGEDAKIFGLNKEAKVEPVPFWEANDIINIQRWAALIIANAYKVPPFMLNLIEDTGSLNAREQKARFTENVVLPILEYESYLYTMMLVIKGFKKLDTRITSPMIGTRLNYDRAKIARILVGDGAIVSADEARKMFFNLDGQELPKETEDENKE